MELKIDDEFERHIELEVARPAQPDLCGAPYLLNEASRSERFELCPMANRSFVIAAAKVPAQTGLGCVSGLKASI